MKVYRSYGGGFGELSSPADENDDAMYGEGAGRLTVITDSVPDIKIYRRSRVMYHDDDDDDDDAVHRSNHRSACVHYILAPSGLCDPVSLFVCLCVSRVVDVFRRDMPGRCDTEDMVNFCE